MPRTYIRPNGVTVQITDHNVIVSGPHATPVALAQTARRAVGSEPLRCYAHAPGYRAYARLASYYPDEV